MSPEGRRPNHLIHEKSPYLLQHAYNPVDWYPWGEEAFEKARREGKPIFLSIGYATCHWCHVMERESFEDEETARFLNEHFVCIKVDREERPDVDQIYMNYVQGLTGSGGWPLSVFLTPEGVPFYGGTYFPPQPRYGMPSFRQVLEHIHRLWTEDRERILKNADTVRQFLAREAEAPSEQGDLGPDLAAAAAEAFASHFDEANGGTLGAPKFPAPRTLRLLLRHQARTGDAKSLKRVEKTLEHMARGGIYDQLGGGFHRYSTDESWLVPHFEKMLYDNAELARAYTEAWQVTKRPLYERIVRETLDYLLRDMRVEGGAFASAEDADSEGEEGRFYTWTPAELKEVLGEELGARAARYFGVVEHGPVEGRSVLHVADENALTSDELLDVRRRLFEARSRRVRPLRDDKVLADWNGLAISALAFAGRVFDEPRYVETAEQAARFCLDRLVVDGDLHRRWRDGEAAVRGHLTDYAFLADALLDLYEADFDPAFLEAARDLAEQAVRRFSDEATGTFFDVEEAHDLLVRPRQAHEGAIPSGPGVLCRVLIRLSDVLVREDLRDRALRCLRAYAGSMRRNPLAFVSLVHAAEWALEPPREAVFAGGRDDPALWSLVGAFYRSFRPFRVILHAPADPEARRRIEALTELARGKEPIDGKPALYLCENYACQAPVTRIE